MGPQLLDIQPRELRFPFELKKQNSCSILLVNKSHNHVAFKIKTTSPKKYCVRPNVGIIMPKSSCEFTVTMQAQRSVPPDMSCKDKFLVQSTTVAAATTDEDITSSMFSKVEGKYVEENKLRVSLVSPLDIPVLSPVNGKVEYGNKDTPFLKDGSSEDDFLLQESMVSPGKSVNSIIKGVKGDEHPQKLHAIKVVKSDRSPAKLHEIEVVKAAESPVKDAINLEKDDVITSPKDAINLEKDDVITSPKDARIKLENNVLKVVEEVGLKTYAKDVGKTDDVEGIKLVDVVQRMRLKLDELELRLNQSEFTISKITTTRQRERQQILKQESELSTSFRTGTRASRIDGFPLLFVVMVALLSLIFGYFLH